MIKIYLEYGIYLLVKHIKWNHSTFSYIDLINNVAPLFQLIYRGHYHNSALRYEYTVPKKESDRTPLYSWVLSDWSLCTATCGGGTQTSHSLCHKRRSGMVEDHFCDGTERPESKSRKCNTNPCPTKWVNFINFDNKKYLRNVNKSKVNWI